MIQDPKQSPIFCIPFESLHRILRLKMAQKPYITGPSGPKNTDIRILGAIFGNQNKLPVLLLLWPTPVQHVGTLAPIRGGIRGA